MEIEQEQKEASAEPQEGAQEEAQEVAQDTGTPTEPSDDDAQPQVEPQAEAEAEVQAPTESEATAPAQSQPNTQANAQANADKRQSARHNVRWRALVLAGGAKIPVTVVDVSDGGLSFAAGRSLATDVQVVLAVFIPDPKKQGSYLVSNVSVQILYQVLRRHEFKFGAKFLTPSAEFLDRMRTAVQRGLS
jgi:hypothetical protein